MTNSVEEGHFGSLGAARAAGDPPAETGDGVAVAAGHSPDEIRELLAGKFVCPFCGSINEAEQGVCPRCTMENSPASRKATKSRIGPWYVLQTRNPAAPGMKFETLLNFAKKGRVKPRSIVRGPTTHQLWKFAAQVKGLSREFGVCYSCGGQIDANTSLCPQCNRLQDPPANPDVLLETKDAPAPSVPQRPSRVKEPDLAEVDAEFVIPALGGVASDDSVAGVTLTGSMAGVAFDPGGPTRTEKPIPSPISGHGNGSHPSGNRNKKDEGFLSPRDLAAAFKLNFSPAHDADGADAAGKAFPAGGERRRTPRAPVDSRQGANGDDRNARPARDPRSREPRRLQHPLDFQPHRPGDTQSPAAASFDGEVDAALSLPRPTRKPAGKPAAPARRRFVFLKVIAFLLLLGGTLYATAIWLDPTLRQQSLQMYNRARSALLNKLDSVKATRSPTDSKDSSPLPADQDTTASASDPGAVAAPIIGPSDTHPARRPATPATAPAHGGAHPASASSARVVAPRPAGVPPSRPAAVSADGGNPPSAPPALSAVTPPAGETSVLPAVSPPAPAATPAVDPAAESTKLYREAMGLEASDPAKAIARYNAIKKYPQEVWPTDLEVRIHRVEGVLKPRSH